MTTYDQIKDEYDMISTEKLKKSQPYHQAKLVSMNILQVNKILPSNKKKNNRTSEIYLFSTYHAFEKKKQKQLKIREKSKSKHLKIIKNK